MEHVVPLHAAIRSRTDEKIRDAVLEIIRTQGLHAVTMESVAAQSGVAKTTLYRRFTDRSHLIVGVIDALGTLGVDPPEQPVTRQALVELLRILQAAYEDRVGLASVGTILASDEGSMRLWREKVFVPHVDRLRAYLERGAHDGALNSALDYQLVVEILIGGMILCDGLRGDVPDDWAEEIVGTLWPLIGVPGPDPSSLASPTE